VPVRQSVLFLPHTIRYLIGFDKELCREVRGIFVRAVLSFLRRRARDRGIGDGKSGAVVVTQRFDSASRLSPHFHARFLDGVYAGFRHGETLEFYPDTGLTDADVAWLTRHVVVLIVGFLRRGGYMDDDHRLVEAAFDADDPMRVCVAGAVPVRLAFGPRQGERVEQFGTPRFDRPIRSAKKELAGCLARRLLRLLNIPEKLAHLGERNLVAQLAGLSRRPPELAYFARCRPLGRGHGKDEKEQEGGSHGTQHDNGSLLPLLTYTPSVADSCRRHVIGGRPEAVVESSSFGALREIDRKVIEVHSTHSLSD
jgi:hypothetical protein